MSVRTEYVYEATIHSVHDGDGVFSASIHIDLGFHMEQTIPKKFRLVNVDTPEVTGRQRKAGIVVRDFVRGLILNKRVKIKTDYTKGKFGRLLAEVYIEWYGRPDVKLSDLLVDLGYAKPFDGKTKKTEWTDEELEEIVNKGIVR